MSITWEEARALLVKRVDEWVQDGKDVVGADGPTLHGLPQYAEGEVFYSFWLDLGDHPYIRMVES